MARYLNDEVPGVFVPGHLLDRLEKAGEGEKEEGIQITLELIEQVKHRGGVNGIHLMPVMWEAVVPRVVTEAGLLPSGFVEPANHEELITAVGSGTRV